MANTNAPFGLRVLHPVGSPPTHELVEAKIAYDNSTAIFTGDPVKYLDTGYVAQWSAATAVSQLAGIFMGCRYLSTSQGRIISNNYWPGSDVASDQVVTALILPLNLSAAQELVIQADSTGAAFADKHLNCDIVVGTGNTRNGRSGAYLDISTKAVTATLPFRIVDLWGAGGRGNIGPGSEAGAYNWVIVRANTSGAGSTGI